VIQTGIAEVSPVTKRARAGLSLRKAAHGEATFHARPHCVIQCVECLRTLKPEKSLGQHVVLSLPRDSYVVTRSRPTQRGRAARWKRLAVGGWERQLAATCHPE
jgi:hypothetical protein